MLTVAATDCVQCMEQACLDNVQLVMTPQDVCHCPAEQPYIRCGVNSNTDVPEHHCKLLTPSFAKAGAASTVCRCRGTKVREPFGSKGRH